jgi:hypothetical protein
MCNYIGTAIRMIKRNYYNYNIFLDKKAVLKKSKLRLLLFIELFKACLGDHGSFKLFRLLDQNSILSNL